MKKTLFLSILILLLVGQVGVASAQTQDIATIEIAQVDNSQYPEVTLYVRILDTQGARVNNLTQDQFTVIEDGKNVDLVSFSSGNSQPISTLMLIDVSSSMRDNRKIDGAKDAALAFVDMMRGNDQVGLAAFNENFNSLQKFTSDQDVLRQAIRAIEANGSTAWFDAVISASPMLEGLSGRKSLLLLSDGLDVQSSQSFPKAVATAQKAGAPVYTIGLGSGKNIDLVHLRQMADETGGIFYQTPNANELKNLYEQISKSTQEEYVISYRSPRPTYDGTKRKIEVKVGNIAGQGKYAESHLVNVVSNLWVGLACLLPLFGLLVLPPAFGTLKSVLSSQKPSASPAAPAETGRETPPEALDYHPATPEASSGRATCVKCGRPLKPGARFCPACGSPQASAPPVQSKPAAPAAPSPQVCPNCGKAIRPGVKFCASCGNRLSP